MSRSDPDRCLPAATEPKTNTSRHPSALHISTARVTSERYSSGIAVAGTVICFPRSENSCLFCPASEARFKYKVLRATSIPSFPRLSSAAMALTAFACGELPTEPPAPARPGSFTALHVEGNRIVDADGADRILRGVAVVDPLAGRASRNGPNPSEGEIETLAVEWNAGIVRVPMHPDLVSHNPDYLQDHVDPLVEWAGERELYLLLGYPRPRQPADRRGRGIPPGAPTRPGTATPTTPTSGWRSHSMPGSPPATATGHGSSTASSTNRPTSPGETGARWPRSSSTRCGTSTPRP